MVMETDKSKRLSLMTKENYIAATEPHLLEDTPITAVELQAIERTLNAHCCQGARAFCLCNAQGDFRRIKRAVTNSALIPPSPVQSFKTPLDRQVSEALFINNSQADILLNSGSEWRAGSLSRASVSRS